MAPKHVAEMRGWLADLSWEDMEADDFEGVPDEAIVRAVERHYDGGVAAFLRDGEAR